eukprot:6176496-Amphidinium_carterae.1
MSLAAERWEDVSWTFACTLQERLQQGAPRGLPLLQDRLNDVARSISALVSLELALHCIKSLQKAAAIVVASLYCLRNRSSILLPSTTLRAQLQCRRAERP